MTLNIPSMCEDVLIESPFIEEDSFCSLQRSVLLTLTPKTFVVSTPNPQTKCKLFHLWQKLDSGNGEECKERIVYELEEVNMIIYNKKKKVLKVLYEDNAVRYYRQKQFPTANLFWRVWCSRIKELNQLKYQEASLKYELKVKQQEKYIRKKSHQKREKNLTQDKTDKSEFGLSQNKVTIKRRRWTDKDLFLGRQREKENRMGPAPVPGIGDTVHSVKCYCGPLNS